MKHWRAISAFGFGTGLLAAVWASQSQFGPIETLALGFGVDLVVSAGLYLVFATGNGT